MKTDIPQTAKIFGVHQRTVKRWRTEGCPSTKDGRRVVMDTVEVHRWLVEREVGQLRDSMKSKLEADDDVLMTAGAGDSPWLEEYRKQRAIAEKRKNEVAEGEVVKVDDLREELATATPAIRRVVTRLSRKDSVPGGKVAAEIQRAIDAVKKIVPGAALVVFALLSIMPPQRSWLEFAEQELVLTGGPHEGERFTADAQPWTRPLLEEFERDDYGQYFGTGSVQSGKTLTFFILPVMYHLFEVGENVIVGCPKLDLAHGIYYDRILPAILAGGTYTSLLPARGPGSRGGKVRDRITFGNGATLRFMGATGGDDTRSSHTARVVVLTEIDRMYKPAASSQETGPVDQIIARSQSFGEEARVFAECTVTTTEGRVHEEVVESSTGTQVHLRCPHCREYVAQEREQFKGWQSARSKSEAGDLAFFECPVCEAHWTEDDRRAAQSQPLFVSVGQRATSAGELVGERRRTRTFGLRWTCMAVSFLTQRLIGEAEYRAMVQGTDAAERKLRQFWWAIPHDPDTLDLSQVSADLVCSKQHAYEVGTCPPDTQIVVGIDLGAHRIHWVATAFDSHAAGSVIQYGEEQVIQPAHSHQAVEVAVLETLRWLRDTIIRPGWRTPRDDQVRPAVVIIDSRKAGGLGSAARALCRESTRLPWAEGIRWVPAMGAALTAAAGWKWSDDRLALTFDSETWKLRVHNGFLAEVGAPGSLAVYRVPTPRVHRRYAKMICAEAMVSTFKEGRGTRVRFEQVERDNHWLDAQAMARVGVELLGVRAAEPVKVTGGRTLGYKPAGASRGWRIGR